MEYWDIYDKNRNKINKTKIRGEKLTDDEYHLVVNAWIKSDDNKFLITQRSENKAHPLMWECTGGSVVKGESTFEGALREIGEELGIEVDKDTGKFIGSALRYYVGCPDILDVWIFNSNVDIADVTIQEEEVCDVMWATKEEILKLYVDKKFEANPFFLEAINFE